MKRKLKLKEGGEKVGQNEGVKKEDVLKRRGGGDDKEEAAIEEMTGRGKAGISLGLSVTAQKSPGLIL